MLRRITHVLLAGGLAALAASFLAPSDAHACGGCFHGEPPAGAPSQSPSVVTDHRMAIAFGYNLTTLWDQVEYAGDPREFAWVLPVRGGVTVGVSSDEFLTALDNATAPEIRAPARRCARPFRDGCGGSSAGGCGGSADSAGEFDFDVGYQEDAGVTVTGRTVVGPYAAVTVHGDDEKAILGWLRGHRYIVPTEIEPVVRKYVTEKFDFVAVRLASNKGIRAMRPIRVSWKGRYPSMPLRMVAAGVGAKVGLKVFVIGDGRWKPKNFPTFSIDPASLSWNFVTQRSDYTTLRDKMAADFNGRAFALETSIDVPASSIPFILNPAPPPDGDDAGGMAIDTGAPDTGLGLDADAGASDASLDVVASETGDASVADTSVDDADEPDAPGLDGAASTDAASDVAIDSEPKETAPPYDAGEAPGIKSTDTDKEIAFGTYSFRRVTRLRADMPAKYLNEDLDLEADENQDPVPRLYQVARAVNAPSCPSTASVAGEEHTRPLQATLGIVLAALAAVLARRAIKRA